MTRHPGPAERLIFLDDVRLFAVLAVVALHTSAAYATFVPWWYVADHGKNAVLNLVLVVTDGFVMPTLFSIAGYFALSSLQRHGVADFLVGKLKRLGVPLVVVTLFFCPIISYVVLLGQGTAETYGHYWLRILPTALDWHLHLLTQESVPKMPNHLWAFYLWFLGMLLVFCGLLALLAAVFGRRTGRTAPSDAGFGLFAVWALLVALAEALGQVWIPDSRWVGFGAFFEFQPARAPLYLGMFLLGVYAWDRQWFSRHRIPGRVWLWGVATIAAYLGMMASGAANMAPGPKPVWIPCIHGLARTLVAVTVTGLLVAVGQRFWNRPGGVRASLAAASYDIYLLHLPLVVVAQYVLVRLDVPPLVKFAGIFLTVTTVCWGASRLASRGRRWLAPTGIVAVFGSCLLLWG